MKSIKKENSRKVFTYISVFILIIGVQVYFQGIDDNFIEKEGFNAPKVINLRSSNVEPFWNYTTGSDVLSVGISDDGKYIAMGSWDHKLYFFQNSSSTPLWSYDTGSTVPSVSISSDGSYIAIGNGWPDYSVYLFHKSSSTPIWKYTSGDGYPRVAISSDGNYIAVAGSQTHYVYLFHRSSSTPIWTFDSGNLITAVSISEDGRYIAAGGFNDNVYLFESTSSTPIWSYTTNGDIMKIDISSDGKYIVAGGSGNNIYLFNKSRATPIWSYNIGDSVESVAISSNGQYIVAGGNDHRVYFFDVINSNPLWNYTTGGTVYSVALSSQGDYIVAGSVDKKVYLFERFSSAPLWNYKMGDKIGSNDIPHCVKISSEGKYLVAGSFDDNIYYFKWNPLKHIRLYTDADNPDPDGSFNLLWNNSTGANNYSVYYHTNYISEINSSVSLIEQGIISNSYPISGLESGIYYFITVAYQDNYNLSSNCIYTRVVNETVKPIVTIENYNSQVEYLDGSLLVNATVMDNDGIAKVQIKISRSDNSIVGIYNMTHLPGDLYTYTWKTTIEFPGNYTFTIIAEDVWGNINDTEFRLFQIINTHQKIPEWTSLSGEWISDVDMSLNGDYIAVGGNNKIYLFNRTSSTPIWSYSTTYGGRSVAISSNGNYIAAANGGGGGGTIYLFGKSSSSPLWSYYNPSGGYNAIAISSEGDYIVAGGVNDMLYFAPIRLFHKSSSTPLWTYDPGHGVNDITISPDGNYIVAVTTSAEMGKKIILFQKDSSTPLWIYYLDDTVWSVDISGDGEYIAVGSGGHDNKIYLFNKVSSTPIWTFSTGGQVMSVKISTDNNYIVAGIENWGGKVYVFNRSSPIPLWSYNTGVNPHLNSVAISSDGSYIIAGNWEYHILDEEFMEEIDYGNIYFFHKSSNIPLWHYRTGTYVSSVSISSEGNYCVGGSSDGIHLFGNMMAPSSFTLTSDAENPDIDGIFNLNWTSSNGAANYSIYAYDKYITEINSSLTLLSDQTATSPYEINVNNGTYYYIVVAHNNYGDVLSNCIEIVVQIPDNDAPIIIIIKPALNDLFGFDAPSYNITILEGNLDSVWYRLDNGTIITNNITINFWNGFLEQDIWDQIGNGTVTISFYVNDSAGNIGQASVSVQKDVLGPIITIISPQNNDIFGFNAPNYDLSIEEFNLDSVWYSLDNGLTVLPLYSLTGTLDQAEWEKISDGTVPIRYYANDSLGHESFSEVVVEKDITSPIITINSLSYFTNNIFGDFAPDYIISINEENLDFYWYTLDNSETNITINSFEGSINEFEWDKHGNGTFIITFYAKDLVGNIGYASALIRKDIIAPIITINSPIEFEFFGTGPPGFEISILEANLELTWYSLDGGITTFSFTGLSGIIDSTEWNKFSNGTVTITFSASDSSLSQNYAEVSITVCKDILGPSITVNNPQYDDIYGHEAPYYDLSIYEFRLDSVWYSLDYGLTNFPLHSLTGILDQIEWEKKGSGTVPIRFHANDSLGHETFIDILVIKDVILPLVTINAPNPSMITGHGAPEYAISITESNLDSCWYTLDGGLTNITINSLTGTIVQSEWDKYGYGTVTIQFYAKDEGGNKGFAEVSFMKDINLPLITINSPELNDIVGFQALLFDIVVVEPNIDAMWYTLDYGVTKIYFDDFSGNIDQSEWNKHGNGSVVIQFFVKDKGGNEAFSEVLINKDIYAPIITIETPEIGDQILDYAPIFSITIQEPNLANFWYSLNNGNTNITLIELIGIIDLDEWDTLPDGPVSIRFYAKDKAGNIGTNLVIVTKITTYVEPPPSIPGYDLYLLIGALSVISTLIIRKRLKS